MTNRQISAALMNSSFVLRIYFAVLVSSFVIALSGCRKSQSLPDDARTARANAVCRTKWGKSLSELPIVDLVVIGAANKNIQDEFRWAFSLYHAVEYGQRVNVVWRDVGGGTSTIETYLLNVYAHGGRPEIDVIWGGGEFTFAKLARGLPNTGPLLEKLTIPPDILEGIPHDLAGTSLRSSDDRWIASALSGFGFIYNAGMLEKCAIASPSTWNDLADAQLADLVILADPTQSGSAAAAYRMIALSADSWPAGWARLLGILANARFFVDSAGAAANAPALGEGLVATCIDFYGITRVAEAPDQLAYVSPRGQTVFSPDPIGILKNAPHPQLAQRFVNFVVSRPGQALWALRVGTPDGPVRSALGRQPVRPDVYEIYRDDLLPRIIDPFEKGRAMALSAEKYDVNFSLLRELVYAATIANAEDLRAARNALIRSGRRPDSVAEFVALPDNVATPQAMAATAQAMKDPKQFDDITRAWRDFFHRKYRRLAEGCP